MVSAGKLKITLRDAEEILVIKLKKKPARTRIKQETFKTGSCFNKPAGNKPHANMTSAAIRVAFVAILAVAGASAFSPTASFAAQPQLTRRTASPSLLRMQEKAMNEVFTDSNSVSTRTISKNFFPATVLDGSEIGYYGFDPLGLASTPEKLKKYSEAEIKHGRLAMLAAAGWPLSEVLHKNFAEISSSPVLLQPGQVCQNAGECVEGLSRAPSVLNGGLDQVSPVYWGIVLIASAGIEVFASKLVGQRAPGDLGFDPLRILKGKSDIDVKRMKLAEIKHSRLAMLAITGFAIQEYATQTAVVNETPEFFKPVLLSAILGN